MHLEAKLEAGMSSLRDERELTLGALSTALHVREREHSTTLQARGRELSEAQTRERELSTTLQARERELSTALPV